MSNSSLEHFSESGQVAAEYVILLCVLSMGLIVASYVLDDGNLLTTFTTALKKHFLILDSILRIPL